MFWLKQCLAGGGGGEQQILHAFKQKADAPDIFLTGKQYLQVCKKTIRYVGLQEEIDKRGLLNKTEQKILFN